MSTQNFVKIAPPVSIWEALAQKLWDALSTCILILRKLKQIKILGKLERILERWKNLEKILEKYIKIMKMLISLLTWDNVNKIF